MDENTAKDLAHEWSSVTHEEGADAYRRQRHREVGADVLTRLVPDGVSAVVESRNQGQAPAGSTWVSHEVLVVADDALYRVAGLDSPDEPNVAVAVKRIPFDGIKGQQVTTTHEFQRGATYVRRRWQLSGEGGGPEVVIDERFILEATGEPTPETAVARALTEKLGWPRV